MQCNIGKTDRTIRVTLGLAILALGVFFGSWWGLIGLVPLMTGVARWCPLYAPFHISTVGRTVKAS